MQESSFVNCRGGAIVFSDAASQKKKKKKKKKKTVSSYKVTQKYLGSILCLGLIFLILVFSVTFSAFIALA